MAGLLAFTGKVPAGANTTFATALGPKFFIIGVWLPEPGDIGPKWALRGINTVVCEKEDKFWPSGTWRAAALAAGMKMIVSPYREFEATENISTYNANPNILFCPLPDEANQNVAGGAPALQALVNAYKADGIAKPLTENYTSHGLGYEINTPDSWTPYFAITGLDGYGCDIFAGGGGDYPYWIGDYTFSPGAYSANDNFGYVSGKAVRTALGLHQYYGPDLAVPAQFTIMFIATGRVATSGGVDFPRQTPAFYKGQFWSNIINGVSGNIAFPQYFDALGNETTDDTASDIVTAMLDCAAKVAILEGQPVGNVLMDTTNGGRNPWTPRLCCKTSGGFGVHDKYNFASLNDMFVAQAGIEMPPWIEGCEITKGGVEYRLAVNTSDTQTISVTDTRWGLTAVSFAPGQVRCFKASAPTVDIFA